MSGIDSCAPRAVMCSALPSWCVRLAGPPLLIAVAGSLWQAVALGRFSPALLFGSLLVGLLLSAVGIGFLSLLEPGRSEKGALSSLSAYLVGFILVSSALLLLAFTSPFAIWLNFVILGVASAAMLFVPSARSGLKRVSFSKVEAFALLLVLVSSGFWSQENLASITVGQETVVSHPWQDIPFHAMQISLFARADGAGQLSNPLMAGQPVPLYHYGSYMVASLLCRLTGLDAYSLTTGWYAPIALVLTGLAAWSLGSSLLGAAGGLAAVFGTMLIPDPSYYSLGNRWTSYFFFQTVGIGAAYAVAILGLSWAFFFKYLRTGAVRLVFAALLFCALSALFKALIFLVYSSVLLVFAVMFAKGISRPGRALLLAALLVADVLGLLLLSHMPNAPTLAISSSGALVNLDFILHKFGSSSPGWLQEYLCHHASYPVHLLLGTPIVLLTTYGPLLLACLMAVCLSVRWRLHRAWTVFPVALLANHLVVALCLEPNHGAGDTFEIIHKTFVFPYFAVVAWTAATLFSRSVGSSHRSGFVLLAVSAAALCAVWQAGKTVHSGMVRAKGMTRLAIPRGLYDAARFIREHAPKDAVVHYSEDDGRAMLAALTERTLFVDRYAVPPYSVVPEEARRKQLADHLLTLPTADSVQGMAAELGIDWLLLADERRPSWAAEACPETKAQGFRLFRVAKFWPRSQ